MKGKWKKITLAVCLLWAALSPGWGSETAPEKYYVLDNGLKVFLQENHKIPMINIGFGVNVGSKDETAETGGMVHLLEHLMLLGGSDTFTEEQMIDKIRGGGLYFNAHTGHDIMTLDISAPVEQVGTAFDLLREKVFHFKPTDEALEKEKKVILEELSQIRDEPDKLGMQLLLRELFKGHAYENPVGGRAETVRKADLKTLKTFYKKYFIPSNCAVSLVGDFEIAAMEKRLKAVFGAYKSPETTFPQFEAAPRLKKDVEIREELDITQAHVFFAFSAPGVNERGKLELDVLTHILGRGVNPLLSANLRGGRSRLVDRVTMNYLSLKYGGAVVIHMVLEPKNIRRARRRLLQFLKTTRTFRYAEDDYQYGQRRNRVDYLETAKTWMRFAYQEYRERGLNLALSYARYMLVYKNTKRKSYKERMEAIRSSALREAASDYLCGRRRVMVAIVPSGK